MRVGVIGCGLIGAALARELQLRGVQTVVYEALGPGQGTSGTTFAWVNANDKEPRVYHDLNVGGIRAHLDLHAVAWSGDQWFFPTGNLAWAAGAEDEARLARMSARLESWDYPVQHLTPGAVRELEPDVRLEDGVGEVLFFPLEGHVLPAVMLDRLLGEALDRGAELRCPAPVEALTPAPKGVRLRLAGGSTDVVDVAVSCVGRWTEALLAGAGYRLPMADPDKPGSETVGYLAYTRPTPVRLGRVVSAPGFNVRPDGSGRLVLQALDLDGSADPAAAVVASGPLAGEFRSRASTLLRGGERVELEAIRVGQRSLPADGLTVAGRLDENSRVYVIVTHSGVTLAPLLARLAAGEIAGDVQDDTLAPFRPQRFTATEARSTIG